MFKLGVYDSGIGGITVLKEIRKYLHGIQYYYLGDTANLPYGSKSPLQVEKLSMQCAEVFKAKQVDALVVACNTASSLALKQIQATLGQIPVYGVVEPGVQSVLRGIQKISPKVTPPIPVVVFATRATVRSHAYGTVLKEKLQPNGLYAIYEQECPLLVPLIEEGWIDHPVLHQTILEYVKPFQSLPNPGVALLGCTHYPWIRSVFERVLPGWIVIDSAQAISETLIQSHLPSLKEHTGSSASSDPIEWNFTDDHVVPSFARLLIESHLSC